MFRSQDVHCARTRSTFFVTNRHLTKGPLLLADLVVEFRQLHFYFLPLEEMILCLLTDRRDQVKLSCN